MSDGSDAEGDALGDDAHQRRGPAAKPDKKSLQDRGKASVSGVVLTLNISGDIVCGDVQNGTFACVTNNGRLTATFDDSQRSPYTKTFSQQPSALFLDPTGSHLFIVFASSGDVEYCNLSVRVSTRISLNVTGSSPAAFLGAVASAVAAAVPISGSSLGLVLTAVGWDMTNTSPYSTGLVLLGCRDGALVEAKIEASHIDGTKTVTPHVKAVVSANDPLWSFREPITGIAVERFPAQNKIVALISSSRRLLRFAGDCSAPSLRAVLEHRMGEINKSTAGNGEQNNGRLVVYRAGIAAPPVGWAWNSPVGIYHGVFTVAPPEEFISGRRRSRAGTAILDFDDALEGETPSTPNDVITLLQIPLGASFGANVPLDISLTAHHMIWMYDDRVVVVHAPAGLRWAPMRQGTVGELSKLLPTTELDYAERLRKTFTLRSAAKAVIRDVGLRRNFFLTAPSFCQIEFKNEHRSSWPLFVERARDPREDLHLRARYFTAAWRIVCVVDHAARDAVSFARGCFYADAGLLDAATTCFAECDRVADVVSFLDQRDRFPRSHLIEYIEKRMQRTDEVVQKLTAVSRRPARERPPAKTQAEAELSCLLIFCLVLLSSQLAAEDRVRGSAQEALATDDNLNTLTRILRQRMMFLKSQGDKRLVSLILSMLEAQGLFDARLLLADGLSLPRTNLVSYLGRGEYESACRVLATRCMDASDATLWYEFAPRLADHCPELFFAALMKTFKEKQFRGKSESFLRPERLLPAFNGVVSASPSSTSRVVELTLAYLRRVLFGGQNAPVVMWNFYILLCARHEPRWLREVLVHPDALHSPVYALRQVLCSPDPAVLHCAVDIYRSDKLNMISDAVKIAVDTGELDEAESIVQKCVTMDPATKKALWMLIVECTAAQQGVTPQGILELVAKSNGVLALDDVMRLLAKRKTRLMDVKEPICNALDGYVARVEELKLEMDTVNTMTQQLRSDHAEMIAQCGIVRYNLRCDLCANPLLASGGEVPFFIYPACRHVLHQHCVEKRYRSCSAPIKVAIGQAVGLTPSQAMDAELLAASDCPTCGELAIQLIDVPFFDSAQNDAEHSVWFVQ